VNNLHRPHVSKRDKKEGLGLIAIIVRIAESKKTNTLRMKSKIIIQLTSANKSRARRNKFSTKENLYKRRKILFMIVEKRYENGLRLGRKTIQGRILSLKISRGESSFHR
jgi:diacylglycerol kinase family enzyme